MILTFGNEQTLLDKLSDSDRELAVRDSIAYGMYCIEEVDGVARRVDVRHVELRNGRLIRQGPMHELAAEIIASDLRVNALVNHRAADVTGAWARLWREALYGESGTSVLLIWKKHDPGAI